MFLTHFDAILSYPSLYDLSYFFVGGGAFCTHTHTHTHTHTLIFTHKLVTIFELYDCIQQVDKGRDLLRSTDDMGHVRCYTG